MKLSTSNQSPKAGTTRASMPFGSIILVSGGALAGALFAHVTANKRHVTARAVIVP